MEIKKIKKKYKLQQEIYLYNLKKKLNLFDNLNYSTIYKQRYYIAEKINLGWDQAYAYKKNGRKIIRNSSKYINENKELEKKKNKINKTRFFSYIIFQFILYYLNSLIFKNCFKIINFFHCL